MAKGDHETFRKDMEEAGREVEEYHGRFYWQGPAVRVDGYEELQDVIRETTISLQWDNMGLGYIVYPRSHA